MDPTCDAAHELWRGRFGACVVPGGVRFRVWAPAATTLAIRLEPATGRGLSRDVPLVPDALGCFAGTIDGVAAGARYTVVVDGAALPDPASRSQPDGVHGPSEVIAPAAFRWNVDRWKLPNLDSLVIYELHVGCFTPEGTYDAARSRLDWLAELGVTAVELMPVAAFPGRRNWGYDGAALYAPAAVYGQPDGLRRFVDVAHSLNLAVILDVVYNHFGPSGAYAAALSAQFFSTRHASPWGAGINLDGPGSETVREFFIDNALHWIHEYRIDGLRLDATHALVDESPRPFLADLTARVHASVPDRRVLVMAEDHRNLRTIVDPPACGGWGLDAVWADDFHHVARRLTAGDDEGYFADFAGTTRELARALNDGWLFQGEAAPHFGGPRGTPSSGLPRAAAIICLQNHDQVGNRADGDRLHHVIDEATYRALTLVLLLAPETPLLFMGQEWAASTPFQYFTDHDERLGALVREGRRREFRHFRAFADASRRARIPDPQADATFDASRLQWAEIDEPSHARMLALYRDALRFRRTLAPGGAAGGPEVAWAAAPATGVILRRVRHDGSMAILVACLKEGGVVDMSSVFAPLTGRAWQVALTTEDPRYAVGALPLRLQSGPDGALTTTVFDRPGAVLLLVEAESAHD
jgi:maltooligosyltrehalose trehalohydrolase